MVTSVCADCKGLAYVGGANVYQCMFTGQRLDQKHVEQRIEIECDKFDAAPRELRVRMKELVEVGITEVHGNGRIQLPAEIRKNLEIADGDKILWIRTGSSEYTFRKVGYKSPFKPHYI